MPPKRQNLTDPSTILLAIFDYVTALVAETEAALGAAAEFASQAAEAKEKARQEFEANEPLSSWKRKRGFDYVYPGGPQNPHGDVKQLSDLLKWHREGWVTYDLEFLTGDDSLSESYKQNWRREIRGMVSDGLLERHLKLIRLTPKGWSEAEKLNAEQPEESEPAECLPNQA